jgi:flagellar hook-associated protein 3 FlgL
MDLSIPGSTQTYLTDLSYTQALLSKAQEQVSSGYQLQNVSDNPAAVAQIYEYQADIASTQQTQTNLTTAANEVTAADTALQSAVQAVESAISIAAQGANSTNTAQENANLAVQVTGLQQTLVSLSQTQVNGSYIFSGDQNTQPAYQLDSTQPEGVQNLLPGDTSTRVILDPNGVPIATALTAQQIFDAQDSNGNPTAGNVFNAINQLLTGLQNNDQTAITNAVSTLQSASGYLNQQLEFYGETANRLQSASDLAQKFLTNEQSSLGQVQDANIPAAALALTQATTQQQAALSVEAKIQQLPTLFSFLG